MMLSCQNNPFAENYRDGFVSISKLPQGVYDHQCFTNNGFIYSAGGKNDNGSIDKVWYAKINLDGYLGDWIETTSLPYAVNSHQCFTANGFVYCVGGKYRSNVLYARINSDGTLDNWLETKSLPYYVYNHQCITANGFIYCVGGVTSEGESSKIFYSSLKSDGTLVNWQETTSLPFSAENHQCLTANGFIYCAGGEGNEEWPQKVWYASLNSNGALGKWQETNFAYSYVNEHQLCITDGYIYCLGGFLTSKVYHANLNTDGTLGTWQRTTSLFYEDYSHQCITVNGIVYCIGGHNNEYPINNVLMHFNPFIIMPTHPNGNNYYITNKCQFSLSDRVKLPYGYYYKIDNEYDTLLNASNSKYTTNQSLQFTSGISVEHGTHYLHIAIANKQNIPQDTLHFKFKTYMNAIEVSSQTHPNQSEWYDNTSFQIELNNKNSNLTYRYILDDYPSTIPTSSSALVDFTNYVFVNQLPGTHYLHIQVFDEIGGKGQPLHFRYNIYDSDEPKPAPLPVVTELNVNPTSVTKDGTISIEGTIEIK